jgi:hypothetical protein
MPHKKSQKGRLMNAQGVELRAVRLELDAATHKVLRVEAAKRDMSMAALVRSLVEEFVAKQQKGSGGK